MTEKYLPFTTRHDYCVHHYLFMQKNNLDLNYFFEGQTDPALPTETEHLKQQFCTMAQQNRVTAWPLKALFFFKKKKQIKFLKVTSV